MVVVDDEDRENEGDLVDRRRVLHARGRQLHGHARTRPDLPRLPGERCDELELRSCGATGRPFGTAFTVSIEARHGVTTGISAHDRAHTIQVAIDPASSAADIVQPGHVFPLRARPGGVLQRTGHTEAAVDLARLAGLEPAGVICEIMQRRRHMARVPDLIEFCRQHDLALVSVADLIEYRRQQEHLVERAATVRLPTAYGEFTAVSFREVLTGKLHLALVRGEVAGAEDVLVRVHSECVTGDVFGSLRCDCGDQLETRMRRIGGEGAASLLYLAQEGRGIGLLAKLERLRAAGAGPRHGRREPRARPAGDAREYGIGAQILRPARPHDDPHPEQQPAQDRGPAGVRADRHGHEPIEARPNSENADYLRTKRERMGHTLRIHHQGVRFEDGWEDREMADWPLIG